MFVSRNRRRERDALVCKVPTKQTRNAPWHTDDVCMCVCVACYCRLKHYRRPGNRRRKLHHTRTCWYIIYFYFFFFLFTSTSFFFFFFLGCDLYRFLFVSNFIFERFWPLPDFLFCFVSLSLLLAVYNLYNTAGLVRFFLYVSIEYNLHPAAPFPAQSKRIGFYYNSFSIPWGASIRLSRQGDGAPLYRPSFILLSWWNQQDFPFCFHSSTSSCCIYTHRDTQPTSAHHDRVERPTAGNNSASSPVLIPFRFLPFGPHFFQFVFVWFTTERADSRRQGCNVICMRLTCYSIPFSCQFWFFCCV